MRALGKTSTVCKEAGGRWQEAEWRGRPVGDPDKHWKLVPAGKEVIPAGEWGPLDGGPSGGYEDWRGGGVGCREE